uniref:Exostosin domain-containing protein n=1 Tax=Ascaris lumbricoides TaxID=6252 RepID=A0A0M3IFL6_ASCLU
MGLTGSKKEEANERKGRAAEVPIRKGRIARRAFSANFVAAQRFLPDYFFVTETNSRFVRIFCVPDVIMQPGIWPPLEHYTARYFSSLFVDEDGDTANEFYRESFEKHKRLTKLVRQVDNLMPKGRVRYPIPRLHPDVPLVLWEVHQER